MPQCKAGSCQPGSHKGWGSPLASREADVPGRCWAREERVSSKTRKACLCPFTSWDRSFVPRHEVGSASLWDSTARWAIWHGRATRGARAAGRLAQHRPGEKNNSAWHRVPVGQDPRDSSERLPRGNVRRACTMARAFRLVVHLSKLED